MDRGAYLEIGKWCIDYLRSMSVPSHVCREQRAIREASYGDIVLFIPYPTVSAYRPALSMPIRPRGG